MDIWKKYLSNPLTFRGFSTASKLCQNPTLLSSMNGKAICILVLFIEEVLTCYLYIFYCIEEPEDDIKRVENLNTIAPIFTNLKIKFMLKFNI